MQIGLTTPPLTTDLLQSTNGKSGLARDQAEFARIMSLATGHNRPMGTDTPAQHEQVEDAQARDAAEQLVSVVLIEPLFKQMREANHSPPPFGPTDGEKQFRSMLDAKLAHEITRAAQFPLVDRLARDLRSTQRTEAQSNTRRPQ